MADHSETKDGLDADEPSTPLWLTALGGALFLGAAVFFLATSEDEAPAAAPAADVGAPSEAPPAAAPAELPPGHFRAEPVPRPQPAE